MRDEEAREHDREEEDRDHHAAGRAAHAVVLHQERQVESHREHRVGGEEVDGHHRVEFRCVDTLAVERLAGTLRFSAGRGGGRRPRCLWGYGFRTVRRCGLRRRSGPGRCGGRMRSWDGRFFGLRGVPQPQRQQQRDAGNCVD